MILESPDKNRSSGVWSNDESSDNLTKNRENRFGVKLNSQLNSSRNANLFYWNVVVGQKSRVHNDHVA